MLLKLEDWIRTFSIFLGKVAGILFILLLFNVFYDVVARYVFNSVSIGMQEMEWHLYSSMFLLGVSYGIASEGHVRVDLIYERLSPKRRAIIDLTGSLVLLMPFALMVAWYGIDFTWQAWDIDEGSGDPGGLPNRWIIKGMIPFSFFAMAISGFGMMLHSVNILRGYHREEAVKTTSHIS
ncbi:MAG: TRAP transporter small permease subunit [Gammaproteobacteria bacterium]|jgi:TRAP-type mannitol/chloroaromatic compound transport system permease small subunit